MAAINQCGRGPCTTTNHAAMRAVSGGQGIESGRVRQARQNTVVSGKADGTQTLFCQHIVSSLPVAITGTWWGQHRAGI